jgi:hypothetical protein
MGRTQLAHEGVGLHMEDAMRTGWLVLGLLLEACSSSKPNLDPAKSVANLSGDDQKALCDWIANLYGGYGRFVACPEAGADTTLSGPQNQADCVKQFSQVALVTPNCPATVGRIQSCQQWYASNACTFAAGRATPPSGCNQPAACSAVDAAAD